MLVEFVDCVVGYVRLVFQLVFFLSEQFLVLEVEGEDFINLFNCLN